jgi:hypothetical protein
VRTNFTHTLIHTFEHFVVVAFACVDVADAGSMRLPAEFFQALLL